MNANKTFATLKPLFAGGSRSRKAETAKFTDDAIEESIHTMAKRLENSREDAIYQFQFRDGKNVSNYCLIFRGGEVTIEKAYVAAHNFGLKTDKTVWQQIASGSLSPLDAFLNGKLLISGNETEGFRMFFRLADDNGQKTIV